MQLVINTQYRENYGAHDWDGTGACPQYWKNKGGSEYILDLGKVVTDTPELREICRILILTRLSIHIEKSDNYVHEFILGWSLEADDYVPHYERLQLEHDGKITYFEPRINAQGERINRAYLDNGIAHSYTEVDDAFHGE